MSPSKTFRQETYTAPFGPDVMAVLQQGQALSSSLIFFSNVLPPSVEREKYADDTPCFFSLPSSHATKTAPFLPVAMDSNPLELDVVLSFTAMDGENVFPLSIETANLMSAANSSPSRGLVHVI